MPRPVTGSVRKRGNRWEVSVPNPAGEGAARIVERFDGERVAERWRRDAVAQVGQGLMPPDAERYRAAAVRAPVGSVVADDIASIAADWLQVVYEDLRRAGPERAKRIKDRLNTDIVPFFAALTDHASEITLPMAVVWLKELAGRFIDPDPDPVPVDLEGLADDDELLTLQEAAARLHTSVSTVRRRWRAGKLEGAYRGQSGRILIPVAALRAEATTRLSQYGDSQSYTDEALWILRRVLAHGKALGYPIGDPTATLFAPKPDAAVARVKPPQAQPRPLTFQECAICGAHLHPIHQFVLWLQRVLGSRIGETFGPRVGDVIDLSDYGIMVISGQGGKGFLVRNDRGEIVTVHHKQSGKTAAAYRVIGVPGVLMEVIRVIVDAYHTDPDTGQVDLEARLVPGILLPNRGGQAAYIAALGKALEAEELSSADLGFRVSSHHVRKSLTTDIAWTPGLDDVARRRFVGQRAGDDVFARIYTLDDPSLTACLKIAATIDQRVRVEIGTLIVPTSRRVNFGRKNPLRDRTEHIEATLRRAGWLIDPCVGDETLYGSAQVAQVLDVAETTARRWMREGEIPTIVVPDSTGVPQRYARLADVEGLRDRLSEQLGIPECAERLGITYHELWATIRRIGLKLGKNPRSGEYVLQDADLTAVQIELDRIAALHARSMKVSEAMKVLRKPHSTIFLKLKRGELERDSETDSSGSTFITRVSVERFAKNQHPRDRGDHIALQDFRASTGLSTAVVMDLVRARLLERVPGRGSIRITMASARHWAVAYRPDLLTTFDRPAG